VWGDTPESLDGDIFDLRRLFGEEPYIVIEEEEWIQEEEDWEEEEEWEDQGAKVYLFFTIFYY